jgi:hypothetical protein
VGVGLNEIERHLAKIFPNPFNDFIYVEFLKPLKTLEMFNVLGQTEIKKEIKGMDNIKINLSETLNGIYFIKLVDFNNGSRIYKIIKQ